MEEKRYIVNIAKFNGKDKIISVGIKTDKGIEIIHVTNQDATDVEGREDYYRQIHKIDDGKFFPDFIMKRNYEVHDGKENESFNNINSDETANQNGLKTKKEPEPQNKQDDMTVLEKIISLKESEIDEFIDARLSMINSKSTEDTTINLMDEPVSSFISDKQTVIINNGGWGFKMNDKSIYKDFINAIRENPNVSPVMHVFHTVYKYFGDPKPTAEREIDQLFHSQENSPYKGEGDAVFDLEEFKNKNIAVCSEFAPMAHNLSCFIGADSYLMHGYKIYEDGERGHKHAFNCLKGPNDTYYLLDYLLKTNNPDGSLGVFLSKQITGKEFDSFINGDIRITCECTNPPLTYETYFQKNRMIR